MTIVPRNPPLLRIAFYTTKTLSGHRGEEAASGLVISGPAVGMPAPGGRGSDADRRGPTGAGDGRPRRPLDPDEGLTGMTTVPVTEQLAALRAERGDFAENAARMQYPSSASTTYASAACRSAPGRPSHHRPRRPAADEVGRESRATAAASSAAGPTRRPALNFADSDSPPTTEGYTGLVHHRTKETDRTHRI
jgi:hypothetical protein